MERVFSTGGAASKRSLRWWCDSWAPGTIRRPVWQELGDWKGKTLGGNTGAEKCRVRLLSRMGWDSIGIVSKRQT